MSKTDNRIKVIEKGLSSTSQRSELDDNLLFLFCDIRETIECEEESDSGGQLRKVEIGFNSAIEGLVMGGIQREPAAKRRRRVVIDGWHSCQ